MARIRTIKPSEIELAEFRGFFFGEGHLDLVRQGKQCRSLSPRARIALREDDKPVLDWVIGIFGGCLSYRAKTRSWCWQITGKERVTAVIDALDHGFIPGKKAHEITLVREALSLISTRGKHTSVEASVRQFQILDELKAARSFGGTCGSN